MKYATAAAMLLAADALLLQAGAFAECGDEGLRDDRILWRFEAQGSLILHRPSIGPDGSIVFMDNAGRVYALHPDGTLFWLHNTGGSGLQGPVAIADDGAVYVASNPAGPDLDIVAISAAGDQLWRLTDQSQEAIAGPGVGPDGNVYFVNDSPGLGALSLTPAGDLRWNNAGYSDFGTQGTQIMFGPAQGQEHVYFCANGLLTATRLDGSEQWQVNVGPNTKQVAVGPGGDVYCETFVTGSGIRLRAFDAASGAVKWTFFQSPTNSLSAPDVGSDGVIYIVRNLNQLHAINPDGTPKWNVPANGVFGPTVASQSPYHGPSSAPDNQTVLVAGLTSLGGTGIVRAFDTAGESLWALTLAEDDRPVNRARFSEDSSVAYIAATNDAVASVYAIRVGEAKPQPTPGDLNGDGAVDVADLLILLSAWGPCPTGGTPAPPCPADLNGDGEVDVADMLLLLANWG